MTLVELIVAISLSAMLMVAIVGVLRGIAIQTKLSERYDHAVWPSELVQLLRRDLDAAESLWVEANAILMRSDVPAYQVNAIGVRPIRYQCVEMQDGTDVIERVDSGHGAILAMGPHRIQLDRIDRFGMLQPLPLEPGPIPNRIRIQVWQGADSEPILVRDISVQQ